MHDPNVKRIYFKELSHIAQNSATLTAVSLFKFTAILAVEYIDKNVGFYEDAF
jgi:hypothetical protein